MAKRLLPVVCACLALAVPACGGDGGSGGLATLNPPSDPRDQLEFGQNATRIGGISPADVAAAAVTAAYPPGGDQQPSSWFMVRADGWHEAVLAAPFATKPINAGLLATTEDYLPTATVDTLARLEPTGYPKGKGLETMLLGKVEVDVLIGLKERKLKSSQLVEKSPFVLSEKLIPFHGGGAGRYSTSLVIASAEERDYALPAAAWSAYSGDTLLLTKRHSLPAATRRAVALREKLTLERPAIYVIGPPKVISDAVVEELSAYGEVQRVGGGSAAETAVALAAYRDPRTQFGWGYDEAPANLSLVNAKDWGNAIGAFTFAATGPRAPLLLTGSGDELPAPVERYLRKLRGDEPSQGFVFGDRQSISSNVFREFEAALGER